MKFARMLIVVYVATIISFIIFVGGDWMIGSRFIVPILPFLYLLVQEGAFEMTRLLQDRIKNRRKVMKVLVIVFCSFVALRGFSYSLELRTLSFHNSKWNQIKNVGIWMEKNLSADSIVALGSAGLIPYYSKLRIIDMYGLMDKTIARKGKSYQDGKIYTKTESSYVLSRDPDYILLFGRLVNEDDKEVVRGTTAYSIDMLEQTEFHKKYDLFWKDPYSWFDVNEYILLFKRINFPLD